MPNLFPFASASIHYRVSTVSIGRLHQNGDINGLTGKNRAG